MRKKRKSSQKALGILMALCITLGLFCGCSGGVGENRESFFLENDRGTYNLAELCLPAGKGPFPLVLISHGFAGNINAGGATELTGLFARAGIASLRLDYNPYTEPDKEAERTNTYSYFEMWDAALSALNNVMDKYPIDRDRLGIYGRSFGGRLSMGMGNESAGGYNFKAMALVAPAGDDVCFERFFGGRDSYNAMKLQAEKTGHSEKLGVLVEPKWFTEVEEYIPTETAYKYDDKPVLVFYNTLDDIVWPDTSIRCAQSYANSELVEVTTDNGHGYEMSYKESELKDMIMSRLVDFFKEYL